MATKTQEETGPVEHVAVTGRPNDVAPDNTTFGDRAKATKRGAKKVDADDTENKAVKSSAKTKGK